MNSAAGQAAPPFRLPAADVHMRKLTPAERSQKQIEKLAQTRIILRAKIVQLEKALAETEAKLAEAGFQL